MKLKDRILDILKTTDGHMTAEEMYLYCSDNGIRASLASVYRVLGELAAEGSIRKVSIPGQPDIFDKTLSEHEHMICIRCGKVKDLRLSGLRESLRKEIGENFDSYDLCIRYLCPECRRREKENQDGSDR